MSTLVTKAYDSLVTLITNSLFGYFRLVNKEDESENLDIFLRKGWCLIIDDENTTNRLLCNIPTRMRKYRLVISNEFYGLDGDHTSQDESIKGLLEDIEVFLDAVDKSPSLGDNEGLIVRADNTSGIDFADKDNRKFIISTINIEIERFKQL
jgi:hypothetical protein